jgi:hypothetical protein
MRFMYFGSYIYSFWIATQLVKNQVHNTDGEPYTAGELLVVMISLVTGIITMSSL